MITVPKHLPETGNTSRLAENQQINIFSSLRNKFLPFFLKPTLAFSYGAYYFYRCTFNPLPNKS